jgi:uncharacterized protein HemY
MTKRDAFRVDGVGCWCPDEMTLRTLRLMGHTEQCTQARKGWEANYRHLSEMDKQRAIDREVGRQLREAASTLLQEV